MKEYTITFLGAHLYPEIKKFPKVCILDDKPNIGESIEIGDNHFKVIKILHRPTVYNIHYSQFVEPTIVFVEYD